MPRRVEIDRRLLKRRLVRIAELAADTTTPAATRQAAMTEVLRALSGDLGMPEVAAALDAAIELDAGPEGPL